MALFSGVNCFLISNTSFLFIIITLPYSNLYPILAHSGCIDNTISFRLLFTGLCTPLHGPAGLLAALHGKEPGKCVGLRADIDALKFHDGDGTSSDILGSPRPLHSNA